MSPKNAYKGVRQLIHNFSDRRGYILPQDVITEKVQNDEIPSPSDFRNIMGGEESILKSSYLTLALMWDIPRRERDEPYFLHPYSVAAKADYRFNDPLIPTKFRTKVYEKNSSLLHDLREVFGKSPIGSHVVGVNVGHFLGDDLAEGLDYMTNTNDIVFDTIKGSFEGMDPEKYKRLQASDISEMLNRRLDKLAVNPRIIRDEYLRLRRVLQNFVDDINTYHAELSDEDKKTIIELMQDSFIIPLSRRIKKNEVIGADELEKIIRREFEHVIGIVDKGHYVSADPKLILTRESPYLVTLDKTLYQDYLNRMMKHAFNKAMAQLANGTLSDDSALSVPIVKNCDSTAIVATLEDDPVHAISQYRHSRRVIESSRGLIECLDRSGVEPSIHSRLGSDIDYHEKILISALKDKPEELRKRVKRDNIYALFIPLFEYMLNKVIEAGRDQKIDNTPCSFLLKVGEK